MGRKKRIFILSDSVGETAEHVVNAVTSQFSLTDVEFHRNPYVNGVKDIEEVIMEAKEYQSILAYTIVIDELKEYLDRRAAEENIKTVDLLNPLTNAISQSFGKQPAHEAGRIRKLDDDYFQRVAAIEFAVKYDDARDARGILKADLVIIGVSRTSKTPLSMYLAHKRFKVANIPLVPEVAPPEELFQLPSNRCVGLVITPDKLNEIRKERLRAMGLTSGATYARLERIVEELEYADKIIKRVGCPVINVSNKAVEETANYIMEVLKMERGT
ncbi:phosphoenolpyruvate synthase regulatory protein [Salipaludibacillus neizhouensis]|uniref:Putative pyruvate, phosphate dikinase regulatory protein n=1 Tax=Salipaludibacillus neizhouensis TaxID=885475 RepID=A0A3A9K3G7_9BACI|nr:pyruvate, water dikinase regulatory protein [Salipaludibacillus neizhouensis]RKL67197.1 phosphoenolpyruvate synthase regulatory protein [Salipaludibacillus neizhouensis]